MPKKSRELAEKTGILRERRAGNDPLAAIERAEPVSRLASDRELALYRQNQIGNRKRLIARYGDDLAYVEEIGWLAWDGKRWDRERGNSMANIYAQRTAEAIFDESEALQAFPDETDDEFSKRQKKLIKHATESCSRAGCSAMLDLAKPFLEHDSGDFDENDWIVALENGVLRVDQPDGDTVRVKLWPHARTDMNTRLAGVAYDPEATAPNFQKFMAEVQPDEQTRWYVIKALAYGLLTGDTALQLVHFFLGNGGDGKSTLLEGLCRIFGDYTKTVNVQTFLYDRSRGGSGPSPDIAQLPGVRLIRTSEPNAGDRLDEGMLKLFTGGEKISARKLRKEFFEFRPRGKLFISLNKKASIVGKDYGIRRRVRIVPWGACFGRDGGEKRDQEEIMAEFAAEASGILNILLDGLRAVMTDGLDMVPEVEQATADYFQKIDSIGH